MNIILISNHLFLCKKGPSLSASAAVVFGSWWYWSPIPLPSPPITRPIVASFFRSVVLLPLSLRLPPRPWLPRFVDAVRVVGTEGSVSSCVLSVRLSPRVGVVGGFVLAVVAFFFNTVGATPAGAIFAARCCCWAVKPLRIMDSSPNVLKSSSYPYAIMWILLWSFALWVGLRTWGGGVLLVVVGTWAIVPFGGGRGGGAGGSECTGDIIVVGYRRRSVAVLSNGGSSGDGGSRRYGSSLGLPWARWSIKSTLVTP